MGGKCAADRAVDMLLAKLYGKPYVYSLSGNQTTKSDSQRMAREILEKNTQGRGRCRRRGLHMRRLYSLRCNDGKRN